MDSAGKPLAGIGFAPWYFQKPGKRGDANIAGGEIVQALTDERGIATFDWLPATTSPVVFFPRTEGYHAPLRITLENATATTTLTARLLRKETIRGRVIGANGKPTAGILVLAQGCGPGFDNGNGRARTAADGSYEMTVNTNQSYVVTVSDDDWAAPSHIGVIVREGRPVAGLDFRLGRGTLIHGTVTIGSAGKPAEAQNVWLHQSGGELPKELRENDQYSHEVGMDRWATTDTSGRYRMRVATGTYSIGIPGQIVQETITINNGHELIHNFRMPRPKRGPISGRIVLAGQSNRGVAGAKIEGVIAEPLAGLDLVITADAEGRFRADRELKKMVVHAESPDGFLGGIVEISGDDAEIEIPIGPTATASGIVLDERGKPVANALLNWGRRVHEGGENAPFRDCFGPKVTTDAEGQFVLPELVVGQPYEISVPIRKVNPAAPDGWNSVGTVLPEKAVPIDLGTLQVGVTGHNGASASSFRDGGPGPGDVAPNIDAGARSHGARTLDGRPLKLEDFRGKFVLLDFWATWCGPCLSEIPHLQAVHQAFGRDPRFVLLSLSVDETIDAPRQFQAKRKLPWMQGFLGQGIPARSRTATAFRRSRPWC